MIRNNTLSHCGEVAIGCLSGCPEALGTLDRSTTVGENRQAAWRILIKEISFILSYTCTFTRTEPLEIIRRNPDYSCCQELIS